MVLVLVLVLLLLLLMTEMGEYRYLDWHGVRLGRHCALRSVKEYMSMDFWGYGYLFTRLWLSCVCVMTDLEPQRGVPIP